MADIDPAVSRLLRTASQIAATELEGEKVLARRDQASQATLRGGAATLAQGLSFGFSDEAAAAVRAAMGGTPYKEAVTQERAAVAEFRDTNRTAAVATEIAGAAPTAFVPLGWASKAIQSARVARGAGQITRGGRVLLGAMGGAAEATVAGMGAGEGDPIDRIVDMSLFTPLAGGALGAGGELLANFAPRTVGAIIQIAKTKAPRVAAREIIQEAMDADGVTPQKLLEIANSPRAGLETLADQGPSLRGRAETALSVPGTEKEAAFVTARQGSRGNAVSQRIKTDLATALKVDKGYFATLDEMSARQREAAAPLYEKAYAGSIPVGDIQDYLGNKTFQDAYKRGYEILEREAIADGVAPPPKLNIDKPEEMGAVPVQMADMVQRGLGEMISQGKRSGADIRSLVRFKNGFLARVDKISPEFAEARAAWSGDAALIDALESGRSVLADKVRPEELERELLNFTESQMDAFRVGVMEAIGEQLDAPSGAARVRAAFGTPQLRSILRAVVPDKPSFDRFEQIMDREAAFAETYAQTIGSSRTAIRQAGQEELRLSKAPTSVQELGQRILGTMTETDVDQRKQLAQELARVLLSPDPSTAMSPSLTRRIGEMARSAFVVPAVKAGFRAATIAAPGVPRAVGLEMGAQE